jgi:glycosyltransferase involved in cell wall biosynthesis
MKDHANFLQAAGLLHQKHPDVQFVLSGKGVCWDNEALRETIQRLGLIERTHLLDERHDIPRITAALDIATSSSYGEGFPNVIGEAMSCGVPCVVTDISDLPWVVGGTGKVVPPRDPQALMGALQELIEIGPNGRQRMGDDARARIMEYFHLDSVVAQYQTLYERVATQQGTEAIRSDGNYQRLLGEFPADTSRHSSGGSSADVDRSRASRS